MKNKKYALELLKNKVNGHRIISFEEIAILTGYSKRHLIRLSKNIEEKDIDSILIHSSKGKTPNNAATSSEIEYLKEFKKQYPNISISQFMDIYHEDVIFNPLMLETVYKHNLKQRSYSFFKKFFHENEYKIPRTHTSFLPDNSHPLREPSSYKGMLVMVDGTPHDWFENGNKFSLHMAVDDATGEILSGWFMATECLKGYCYMLKILIQKHGIPETIYSDKHTIFKSPIDGNLTQFGRMCKELGINLIFAGSPQAKGKVEKKNDTVQGRLLNDIIRHKITSYSQLNQFFNDFYVDYLNKKFAYEAIHSGSLFVPIEKDFDFSNIFCIKETRKILNGCLFSFNNNYYQILDNNNNVFKLFKGSTITVMNDIFDNSIKVEYRKQVYKVIQVATHLQQQTSTQQVIQNQKELEQFLNSQKQ